MNGVLRGAALIQEVKDLWKSERGDLAADLGISIGVFLAMVTVVSALAIGAKTGVAAGINDLQSGALQQQLNAFTAESWSSVAPAVDKKTTVTLAGMPATVASTITQDPVTGVFQMTAAVPVVHASAMRPADCTSAVDGHADPSKCLVAVAFNTPTADEWVPPQPVGFTSSINSAGVGVQLATLDLAKLGAVDGLGDLRLSVDPAASVAAATTSSWAVAAICSDSDVMTAADESSFVRASNGWLSATVNLANVAGCSTPTIRLISTSATQPTSAQVAAVDAWRLAGGVK
ncbi:hypothetical protein [Gryllotalpicola protaetiae]|uniref:Uncharacterized protein n=1 Tax=Gryllotalpicola protaetiae TaxID=2419771 RepID=A0A387BM32_9MICO|nr:hypothetical protein [Gryllotalpicola protaetiae]AYG03442.1 hypothetical protein D7I44_07755 [Gryllotalpicola protaetiae]